MYDAEMIASIRPICFVPGLPTAWYLGNPRGLLWSLAFMWSASILLLATFVWPEWMNFLLVRCLWITLIMWWAWESLANHLSFRKLFELGKTPIEDNRFVTAQDEYLRGNWFEAEAILLAILTDYPRDAEAHLLLVSVLRHTRRWNPALRRLQLVETLEASAKWRFEISRERQLIQKLKASQAEPESSVADEHQESTEMKSFANSEQNVMNQETA